MIVNCQVAAERIGLIFADGLRRDDRRGHGGTEEHQ